MKCLAVVVCGTIGGNVVASVDRRAPTSAGLEGQAGGASVPSLAASRDDEAFLLGGAPSLAGRADALQSLAVVIGGKRAVDREGVAGVSGRAPAGSGVEGQASSATIVCRAARGDLDALLLGEAPTEAGRAGALQGLAVVVGGVGAVGRDVIAGAGETAPSSVGSEGQTSAAVVVGEAAGRYDDAFPLGGAPGLAGGAGALQSCAVVVRGQRAVGGEGVALSGDGT